MQCYGSNFSKVYFTTPLRSVYKLDRSQEIKFEVHIECEWMVMFTCQQLGIVGVGEVEALQRACDPGEILATARVSGLQHSLGAGDLRDQHAPVPGLNHLATN